MCHAVKGEAFIEEFAEQLHVGKDDAWFQESQAKFSKPS